MSVATGLGSIASDREREQLEELISAAEDVQEHALALLGILGGSPFMRERVQRLQSALRSYGRGIAEPTQ